MEKILSKKGDIIAIIIRGGEKHKGVAFFTPPGFSQQVGLLSHKAGNTVKPHVHKRIKRKVEITQEVLHIRKGKIALDLYDESRKLIARRRLKEGNTVILASAGHGLRVLEESRILEIKQGPYAGVDDKEYIKVKR